MVVTRRILDLLHDRSGVAASEFALVLPVLVLLLFGTVELGNALLLDKKVTAASQTAADLVAQQKVVTSEDLVNIWAAIDNIIAPFDRTNTVYHIASIVADADGNTSIAWQEHRGGSNFVSFTLPAGLVAANESVIVASITYSYTPVFGDLLFDPFDITDTSYLRPRTVDKVSLQ